MHLINRKNHLPLGVLLPEVNNVNVSLVNRFHGAHTWIYLNGLSSINASDGDSVTRRNSVHKVIVSEENDRVRRLTGWHVVRGLLDLDHLPVGEETSIVHNLKGVTVVAVSAERRLGNPSALVLNGCGEGAHDALEEGLSHLRNYSRSSDDHSADGDELIDVLGIQAAHGLCLVGVERANLNLMIEYGGWIPLEEHLVNGHVESRNDLLRITHELLVELRIEVLQV